MLHQEPGFKQRGDLLKTFLSSVIDNLLYNQLKIFTVPFKFFEEQKMMTPLGSVFSTDEKTIAQIDLKLLESKVESLVVEFDQEKFEELLSLSSISPKSIR